MYTLLLSATCKTACTLNIVDVSYILILLGTLAIRNADIDYPRDMTSILIVQVSSIIEKEKSQFIDNFSIFNQNSDSRFEVDQHFTK